MFVSPAFAQAGGDVAGAGAGILQFLPLILIFVVFYFLLIRPQQKKLKQHRDMLAAIRRGDRIVTGGGIIGTVNKVIDDNEVMVEIAEGVRVRVHKPLISAVLAKTEAAPAAPAGPGEPANDTPAVEPPKGSGVRRFLGGKKE
ncbi:MAG TPA: preprotein translocase subunit YajC [Rhodospirillales bacterium]|jgi:preprotein translocase subunit YajC|nr:preprotein translocase subunit YajC [Rhodospirillales bacterium]